VAIWAVVVFQVGMLFIASAGPGSLSGLQVLGGILLVGLSAAYATTAVMVFIRFLPAVSVPVSLVLTLGSVPVSANARIPFLWSIPTAAASLLVVLLVTEWRTPRGGRQRES